MDNKDKNAMMLNDELLKMVSGGAPVDLSEYSQEVLAYWKETYQQPDGSYLFRSEEDNLYLKTNDLAEFIGAINEYYMAKLSGYDVGYSLDGMGEYWHSLYV